MPVRRTRRERRWKCVEELRLHASALTRGSGKPLSQDGNRRAILGETCAAVCGVGVAKRRTVFAFLPSAGHSIDHASFRFTRWGT
jgi:hypothetical protein